MSNNFLKEVSGNLSFDELTNTVSVNKTKLHVLLVDAIASLYFMSLSHAAEMEDKKLAKFVGNQWNPDWGWDKNTLSQLTTEELTELYGNLKENEVKKRDI